MKLALHGASGRMGAAVLSLARTNTAGSFEIVGAAAERGCAAIGRDLGEIHGMTPVGVAVQDDIASALLGAEVVIDFSHRRAVPVLAKVAAREKIAIVSGTTGLDAAGLEALDEAAKTVPVLWAPNMSLGIQVLAELVQHAVRRLGAGFDVEIVEVHHRNKADAPSGTASRLAREVEQVRGELRKVGGREGMVGARTAEEMGVLAVRGGDVVGDHTVHLLGNGERLELTHRATSRELFARGALFAAKAIVSRPAGRYTLADILRD